MSFGVGMNHPFFYIDQRTILYSTKNILRFSDVADYGRLAEVADAYRTGQTKGAYQT